MKVPLPQKVLRKMNNRTVQVMTKWLWFNTHATCDVVFLSQREEGLGVLNIELIYTATRLTHLLNMLNSDDVAVKGVARGSLILDLRRRKAPLATDTEDNFLGQGGQWEIGACCGLWSLVRLAGPQRPVQLH